MENTTKKDMKTTNPPAEPQELKTDQHRNKTEPHNIKHQTSKVRPSPYPTKINQNPNQTTSTSAQNINNKNK